MAQLWEVDLVVVEALMAIVDTVQVEVVTPEEREEYYLVEVDPTTREKTNITEMDIQETMAMENSS